MAAPRKTFGKTSERPTGMAVADTGFAYFDTDISMPIWWNGYRWVDYAGTGV